MDKESTPNLARCADGNYDPELFFPISKGSHHEINMAKAVCRRCPIRGACLGIAISERIDHGVWGGTDEWERKAARETPARLARFIVDHQAVMPDTVPRQAIIEVDGTASHLSNMALLQRFPIGEAA